MAKTQSEARRERLAAALRANLKRRKAGAQMAIAEVPAPEPSQGPIEKSDADARGLPTLNVPR
ncbi:MAG TPA: hypothetical protein VHU23_03895 [Rhizomicrobium sp.]|nr:hypothetical protein [Rhizomicrobium sp.]